MPVIVVGADTEAGAGILDALHDPKREIRAFVSDVGAAERLRSRGYKVALGDVSDQSHIEGASTRCFSAVLIGEAARDGRERSFAKSYESVLNGWASAVESASVTRVIWVIDHEPPQTATEVAVVRPDHPDLSRKVADLDDARVI